MKSRTSIALVLFVVGLVLAFWFWRRTPSGTGAPTTSEVTQGKLREIRVAQWGKERYLIYLPLYVAIDEKLLEKRGVDAEILFTGNDDQTFAAVVAGSAEVGVGDPTFAAVAVERGLDARVIGTVVSRVAIWGVTKDAYRTVISEPQQLAGLRVGTFPEPSTNHALMAELASTLGPDSALTIVQAGIGNQIALLEADAADIAMELEPAASIAESNGYRVIFSSPGMHGDFAFTGVTTTLKLLNEKRELLADFVSALEEAVVLCHTDPEVAIWVAKKSFPDLADEVVRNAVRRMLEEETLPKSIKTSDVAWDKAIAVRQTLGQLENGRAFRSVVDNSLLH